MNHSRPPIIVPEKLQEEISAYLDGELTVEDGREVEQRLAAEPHFRDELQGLERAWRLLDELPRPEVDERFASTTVEMVAVKVADELKTQRELWPRQFARGWILSAGGMLLALLLGFGVVAGGAALLSRSGLVQDADDRLLADLSVLENIDQYQQIDSIESLRKLADSGLFAKSELGLEGDEKQAVVPVGATSSERTAYVQQLRPYQRKELSEKRERLESLPRETQDRLRALDKQLAADPRADDLRDVMARYTHWLSSLPLDIRAEVRGLELEKRLARISSLRQQDRAKVASQQSQQDLRVTMEWLQQQAERNAETLTQQMLPQGKEEMRAESPLVRRKKLMMTMWQRWQQDGFGKNPHVSAEEFAKFKGQLSPGLRQRMEMEGTDMAAQWKVLTATLLADARSNLAPDARRQFDAAGLQSDWPLLMRLAGEPKPGRISADMNELMRFFHEKLSPAERDSYKRLPRDEFFKKLRARYAASESRERTEPLHHWRNEPGGQRGPERPRPPRHEDDFRGPPPRPDGEARGPEGPEGRGFEGRPLEGRGPEGRGPGRGGPGFRGPGRPDEGPPEGGPAEGPPPPQGGAPP